MWAVGSVGTRTREEQAWSVRGTGARWRLCRMRQADTPGEERPALRRAVIGGERAEEEQECHRAPSASGRPWRADWRNG